MNAFYLRSLNGDPFYNLAVEEYLLYRRTEQEIILFLWQSDNAVVIGRHQNPWIETDCGFMTRKRITLARRLSGGGAVYHDRGNLNFSFIGDRDHFDIDRQLQAVCESLNAFGIRAEPGNRKALQVAGKKFSGSAFAMRRGRSLHHGTMLIDTDLDMMRALKGGLRIYGSRGTLSENARVVNLGALNPFISVKRAAGSLVTASAEVLGYRFTAAGISDLADRQELAVLYEKQRSWEWRFGSTPGFHAEFGDEKNGVAMQVEKGRVGPVTVFPQGITVTNNAGARFHQREVGDALEQHGVPGRTLVDGIVF